MYSVLIVEDEILVSAGLQNMIRWSDMDMTIVGCARNGKQGIEMYHSETPDIILTDLKMPVLDGIDMIREIRKNDVVTKIIVLTSYEEYELIREAFKLGISDYILKLKMMPEDIENVIRKVHQELEEEKRKPVIKAETTESIRERMIACCKKYILHTMGKTELIDALTELNLVERKPVVWELELIQSNQMFSECVHLESNQLIVVQLIQKMLDEKNTGIVFQKEKNQYVLVLGLERTLEIEKQIDNQRRIVARIQSLIQNYMDQKLVFGISSINDNWEMINQLYEEANTAREHAVFLDEEVIFYGNGEDYKEYISRLKRFEESLQMLDSISKTCRTKILSEIEFFRNIKYVPNTNDIKEAFVRWIHRISFDEIQHKEDMLKITLDAVEKMRLVNSFGSMTDIFETYLQNVKTAKECKMVSAEVSQAIMFLSEHYMENSVSLSMVSHMVGMNKDYFSSLFKRETGYGLVDYVNRMRIGKAKELFNTTNKKAYEICFEVGFQDESYFSRVFKKITGMSPNEYKKKELKDVNLSEVNFFERKER